MVKRLLTSFLLGFCLLSFAGVGMSQESTVYVGSKNSTKYHYTWCKWAKKISPRNRVTFKSAKEAQDSGYVPCKVCKPPVKD